jgi:ABC-type nitrate/sulfonate/bicarbonate transport system permease component
LAFTFTGLRIGLARGWRALVAGEMLASTEWGLGWAIFDSREFLATDVMLVMISVIGLAGFLIEIVLFQFVEKWTVVRWGMVRGETGGG